MQDKPADQGRSGNGGTWAGFLAMAFCIVGMIGLFATYAAPLPYQREMRREAVLDQVLTTAPARLEALRDGLGDSAAPVLSGPAPLAERVALERTAVRGRFAAEAEATAQRLRLLTVVVTIMGAVFGAILLGLHRRN